VYLNYFDQSMLEFRNRGGIATNKDKILFIFMIVLAVLSNAVAIYSDAYALFKKNASPREWFLVACS